ncbi:hypothetical protein GGX14DRAFT_442246 [Mycena pura]|uniref:Uncharacterized protein n=1 Tax=Mycena pura TaxID=153505 RepID=A0AAD6VLT7_9AGAR|nr:hypothetical protein GGX14DRAFT_442246 [Mycena pura]
MHASFFLLRSTAAYIRLQPFPSRFASISSRHVRHSHSNKSFTDPTRADLHYHFFDPPSPSSSDLPAFALSFLSSPPSSNSSTIIGWLAAATATRGGGEAGLNDFKENPGFRTLLHEAIQEGLRQQVDDIQINGALQLGNGWMHIHDDRNIPALGRIGDPDDIIASVLVEDGKIRPETYQPMPAYRLCTSDGPTQLTPGLAQKLRSILEGHADLEKG